MKLLIVEDNEGAARALSAILMARMDTLECCIAANLQEGLRLAQTLNADITLLDLMLPGSEVEEVIKSIGEFTPPVIIVTDVEDSDHKIMMDCYAHGCENFISKSVLRTVIDSLEHRIQEDILVRAIIDAHFRNVLPRQLQSA